MAMTEADRLFMHEGFRECMTEKVADLLMEHLPPTGWADVARVQDIENLERVVTTKIDALDGRVNDLSDRIGRMDSRMGVYASIFAGGFIFLFGAILTKL
jgi:hypothetical protein